MENKKKMKVLLIDVNCKSSSTGKIVYDLYQDLKASGNIPQICYGRGVVINEPNIYKFGLDVETYAHALLTRVTGLTGMFSPLSTRDLINQIEKFKPDIVHIHELHAYFINIAPIINYLKEKNIKTVWTFHCEFMYTGKCGYAYECDKWKIECNQCPKLSDYPSSLFFDFTKKMFNDKKNLFSNFNNLVIVTPSKWLADRTKESFLKDKDIRVIHNGIDTENIFFPRTYAKIKIKHNLSNEKIVLSVAPDIMNDRKGGRHVLEIAKRFSGKNVKFILIGVEDTTEKFDDNVIALGRTTNQIELAEYYSMADLLLLTSEKETFSLVVAESLACATSVLGFNSGAPEEIAPKGYGVFVEYGDIESLIVEMNLILEGKKSIKTKNECERFAKEYYSKEMMTKSYINLYNEILGKK